MMSLGCGGNLPEANPTADSMEIFPAGPLMGGWVDVLPFP
jgi:hypothetical protein